MLLDGIIQLKRLSVDKLSIEVWCGFDTSYLMDAGGLMDQVSHVSAAFAIINDTQNFNASAMQGLDTQQSMIDRAEIVL
jgi:hypothetical protein